MTATLDHQVAPAPAPASPPQESRGHRRDIQGLRAIAVLLVVLYHCNIPGLTGGYVGVDVFFVISGFLITGQILREIDRHGRISLPDFYARRIRRLLPAALLVIATTVIVARVWGPALQLRDTAVDAIFTAGYAINFRLASEGVNYQQANGPLSPLQHFWSLAVEEQFYILWPIVLLLVVLLARKARHAVIAIVIAVAVAVSLYLSITITSQSAPTAYFSVQTRAWEFGFGALLAVGIAVVERIHPTVRSVATWAGLGLILTSAFAYNDSTAFPGTAALMPVLGCALVIAGGCGTTPPRSVASVLNQGPLQLMGRFSYSWYLWHWPMLILLPVVLGLTNVSWMQNVEISVLALWIAGLTYAIVERPTQRGGLRKRVWLIRGLALSGAGILVAGATIVIGPTIVGNGQYAKPLDLRTPSSVKLSAALVSASTTQEVPENLTPSLENASADTPVTESGCHLDFLQVTEGPCVYGDTTASKTVVLFGDSHAQQWDGALDVAAKALHWRLISWTKAACPAADISIVNPQLKRQYTECDQWRKITIDRINSLRPSLVLVSQSDTVPGKSVTNQKWATDTVSTVRELEQSGTRVVFLADTPYPKSDIPTCVAANLNNIGRCELPRSGAYQQSTYYADRHATMVSTLRSANVQVVDPINWLCSSTICPVIVGNTLVYRDDSHMTNTYSTLLGPLLEPILTATATEPRN